MPALNETVLEVTNLTKKYGSLKAVDDLSLKLKRGEIFALVGPNGSGKTTLLSLIVGLIEANSGKIMMFGMKQPEQSSEISQQLGYIPDNPDAYPELTGLEFLYFVAALRRLPKAFAKERIKTLLKMFELAESVNYLYTSYSRGTKQKIAIMAALLDEPKFLVIDEPIVGLDPQSIDIFGKTLTELGKNGVTIIYATHILDFVTKYANRIGFIKDGKIQKILTNKRHRKLDKIYQKYTKK